MPYKDPLKNKAAKERSAAKHAAKNRARLAKFYVENKEFVKARSKAWRAKNRDKMLGKLREYRKLNYVKLMLVAARYRAKVQNVPFRLREADIYIPFECPILGIELAPGVDGIRSANSPSLDRIIPELGYVPDNVRVISWRANSLKRDGTAEEFERIAAYIRGEL